MSKQTLGEFLATLRKANGFTQLEVAEKLGISNRTLSAWECGTALPDILLLPALADMYNVTVDEIIAGERKSTIETSIANKSQRKLLQNKLSKITTPSLLLTGIAIVGILLFFVGLYIELTTIAWTGWQWWLLLLFVGAITLVVCLVILIAMFAGAKSGADEEMEGYNNYCILLSKRLSICYYAIAIAFAVLVLVGTLLPCVFSTENYLYFLNNLLFGNLLFEETSAKIAGILMFVNGTGTIVFALLGFFTYRTSLKKQANDTILEQISKQKKQNKKLSLWGLIAIALAVACTITSICLTNTPFVKKTELYQSSSKEDFIKKVECLHFDAMPYYDTSFADQLPQTGEYYLPLSANANSERDMVNLGKGFYARYSQNKDHCDIYVLVNDIENNNMTTYHMVATAYRYYSPDKSWSVYVAQYWNYPVSAGENGKPLFAIEEHEGKISLYSSEVQNSMFGGHAVMLSYMFVCVYYSVVFVIASIKMHKIKIKLYSAK